MRPQQWEYTKRLFEAALTKTPEQRARFLEENCGGDEAIRNQVTWLLESNDQAGSFLERPFLEQNRITPSSGQAIEPGSASRPATTVFPIGSILLDRFRIVTLAGRGGMGEVYEAEDLELHDRIALKTIRSEIARDPDSIARFKREIQLARRISHPNVVRLFDLFTFPPEHEERRRGIAGFVTMQLLCGITLEEKIRSIGHLQANETISIAIQICKGLGAAHRIGIIHRDFKSSNVMLVPSGPGEECAVIMDFGLAFTMVWEDAFSRLTGSGAVIGTLPYMAPEQLEGGPITPATDIYALGLVLYEMTTGTRPFAGASPIADAVQRLRQPPRSPRVIRPDLDSRWEAVILKCLEYYPERRYRSTEGLEVDLVALRASAEREAFTVPLGSFKQFLLRRLGRSLEGGAIKHITEIQGRQKWLIPGVLAIAAVMLLLFWYGSWPRTNRAPTLKLQQVTAASTENPILHSALSPDGKVIAYGDEFGIHLELISTHETRTLLGAERSSNADIWWPVDWFPDGNHLLANSARTTAAGVKLAAWMVSTHTGNAVKLREDCAAQSVSPDSSLIAFTAGGVNSREEIWVMGSHGEAARKVVNAQNSGGTDSVFSSVRWSPDGQRIAFRKEDHDFDRISIQSVQLKGGSPELLAPDAEHWGDFCWSPPGRLLFASGSQNDSKDMNLWEMRTDRRPGVSTRSQRQLTDWNGFSVENLSPSRDGARLSFDRTSLQTDVFVAELGAKGSLEAVRRLTLDDYDDAPYAWAPDGKTLFFTTDRPGYFSIQKQNVNETEAQPVVTSSSPMGPVRLSPDGSSLFYVERPPAAHRLMIAPASEGIPQEVGLGDRGVAVNVVCSNEPAVKCLVGTLDRARHQLVFWDFELPGRDIRRLFAVNYDLRKGLSWTLSPDGTNIAVNKNYQDHAEIEVYSLTGVVTRRVRVNGFNQFFSIDWAAQGASWFVGTGTATGSSLLRVYQDGRDQVLLNMRGRDMHIYAIPSRNGKKLAILGWTISRNVWMIDQINRWLESK